MEDKLISIILLSYQSESRLEKAVRRIRKRLAQEGIPYEVIIIDDGSSDKSPVIAQMLANTYSDVKAFQLSRNYTSPYAQFAGLSVAQGACAVFVPDDFQRPLDTVIKMYRLWQKGHKIVINYRETRNDSKLTNLSSHLYYKIMNKFSIIDFPPGGADGFLADREVINVINQRIHPINTSLVAEVLRLGYDPYFLPSPRPKSEGKSRWTFRKKFKLALDTFFASSSFPIKLITSMGLLTFIASLLSLPLLIYARFFLENKLFGFDIPGWTTIIFTLLLFNGLVLLSLGVVAEYIWRIFEEVKDRPGFLIRNEIKPTHIDSEEE